MKQMPGASEFRARLAKNNEAARDRAIEELTALVKDAKESPVNVPIKTLTSDGNIRQFLLDQLKNAGWRIEPSPPGSSGEAITHYLLS